MPFGDQCIDFLLHENLELQPRCFTLHQAVYQIRWNLGLDPNREAIASTLWTLVVQVDVNRVSFGCESASGTKENVGSG